MKYQQRELRAVYQVYLYCSVYIVIVMNLCKLSSNKTLKNVTILRVHRIFE